MSEPKIKIADDLLAGVKEIAQHINKSERQVYHLLESRQLPGFKIGSIWHLRRSTLSAFIARREAENGAA